MPRRCLVPIPLPHGRTGNTGRLSIYFSPRLLEGGVLSDYPDWRDWPAALASFSYRVHVNGAQVPFSVVSPVPSTTKWKAVFAAATPVEPDPMNGSRTRPPGGVTSRTRYCMR
mgnify:CR=1 FL=1